MRYIFHATRFLLRSATQYRASYIMQVIAQLLMTGGDLLAVLVLMDRFSGIGQWTPAEILFFFGMMELTFALVQCFGRGISFFPYYVGSGEFDVMLLRPRSLLLQVICKRMDPRRLGGMMIGTVALLLAGIRLNLVWTAEKVLLLLFSCAGTFFLLLGLFLVEATVSFFTAHSMDSINVLTYGGKSACQYPIDIYPKPLKFLFTCVAPFALCMHLPVSTVLGKPLMHIPSALVFLFPLLGLLLFLVMAQVWRIGVRHYRSTGT